VCCGGCRMGPACGGCCTNPCGSAFAPTCGGHSSGCGCGASAAGDPFIDDPLPQPTATPVPEVRRAPSYRTQPAQFQTQAQRPAAEKWTVTNTSASANGAAMSRKAEREPAAPIVSTARLKSSESVLRKASVE